jgi:YggT family protein
MESFIFFKPFILLIDRILSLIVIVLFLQVIISWLIAFNIINTQNRMIYQLIHTLNKLTEPLLSPIRKILPDLGSVDISPVIFLLILYFLKDMIHQYLPL